MTKQTLEPSTSERLEELTNLVREIKHLATARSLSLPAVGITSAAAAVFGPALAALGLIVLGTAGLGVGAVVISRQLSASKTARALALAKDLRDENALSEEEFAEYMRSFKNASEESPVKA